MNTIHDQTEATRTAINKLYDAILSGDVEGVINGLSDDITVSVAPFMPSGGVYHGKEEFFELVGYLMHYADLAGLIVEHLIVDGERAVAVLTLPELDTGLPLQFAEHWEFRDGIPVAIQIYYFNPQSAPSMPKFRVSS